MPARPMLGEIELQLVQKIETDQDQVYTRHDVPALEGDFLQGLGRRAAQFTLSGVLTGPTAGDGLKTLRDKFRAAEPVSFSADITTATRIDQVIIEEMGVREVAGKPERFEYTFTLREYLPPAEVSTEKPVEPTPPSPPDRPIDANTGALEVEVVVEGQPDFDFSQVAVTVRGTQQDGGTLSRTLSNRTNNLWTDANVPASQGEYTVEAATATLNGATTAAVRPGQTTRVRITLQPASNVATTFLVHFRFDSAFVEPCMRPVLRQAVDYARNHPAEKLLIVGHTDKVGSGDYNQSLSERRARSVYAFLTFGVDQAHRDQAIAEWNALRVTRPTGEQPSIKDSWGVREYQHILQDLRFYPGAVDGDDGPLTQEAVRAYRCHKGLPPGTTVDAETWTALITDYLAQENFNLGSNQFFPNCPGEILKWLGCGEDDPVDRTGSAHRPSRRTEMLFVRASQLPCDVPQPVTFNLPAPGAVNTGWCLDSGGASSRCCFVSPVLQPGTNQPQPCPSDPNGPWCRRPAEPGTITAQGAILRELPDGTLQPAANQRFVLISPKGQFKEREQSNGEPVAARTTAAGDFSFSDMPRGFYSLEVVTDPAHPVLVRLREAGDETVKGNVVCKALRADSDRLEVVIIDAPVKREIRLPLAAHLMTPLNSGDRQVRTCPDPANPANQLSQATSRSEADIQTLFAEVNRIWRQARIRFDPVDVVQASYAHPVDDPAVRGSCQPDQNEFTFLLSRCAYPEAINVFFWGDLSGSTTAGFGLSVEAGAAGGLPGGAAVADRFQTTLGGTTLNQPLSPAQSAQVLAHQLGRYLNLEQTTDSPANAARLMRPTTLDGSNRTLIQAEVDRARTSQGASDDCVPLTLRVSGATQIGGSLSHQFLVLQDAAATVTVQAEIPERMLDPSVGALTMSDGSTTVPGRQFTVSGATAGETTVTATYTPVGGQPVSRHVVIRVVTFTLRVEGATRVGSSDTFIAARDASQTVTVVAQIDPAPFCTPHDLVTWQGGTTVPDPLRRGVPRSSTGSTTVRATLAGTTRTVEIVIFALTIPDIGLVGLNQTFDVPLTVTPALPTGASLELTLSTTSGSGAAQFTSTNSAQRTISGNTTVTLRGTAVSSTADNLRLSARITGQTEVIAQDDFTVVGVTIGSVLGVRPGQTIDIPVTVSPSPLPAGRTITLTLSTASGTGRAEFASGNPTSQTINGTTTVTVRGVTPSNPADNIRLTARITGQSGVLAQEDFTVLSRINLFVRFEVWNLNTQAFEPLPAGIAVDLMDEDPISDDTLATSQTDAQGRVLFSLADFSASGEDQPDLYFKARPNGVFHAGHVLPAEWSTKGWRATNGQPGLFDNFSGTQLGSETNPLTYRIGLDVHARLTYHVDAGGRAGNNDPAPDGCGISILVNGTRKRTFTTTNAEIHGVIFDVEGGDRVTVQVDFDIRDPAINQQRAKVDLSAWELEFDDNAQTSLGTQTAPLIFHATSEHRNVALYILKVWRELSIFLFHLTGGAWTGINDLEFKLSSISGVAFSWPVGTVNLPPSDHWDRGTIVHESTHQTMWKEHHRSSADIAFEALFGNLALTHHEALLSNPEHALIEGWAEITQAIFAGPAPIPYTVNPVSDSNFNNPQPLGPPPPNRGESVEGAFANGMFRIFVDHVVTPAVLGAASGLVGESSDGNILTTTPWLTNVAVRGRFMSMIWDPFRDLLSRDKTTTAMIARIRARNASVWHLLQAELQQFNMAMDVPTVTSVSPNSGPAAGGQTVTIRGNNFVPGTQVRFAQAPPFGGPATGVTVTNSTTLTAVTPSGTVGSANIIVTTPAGPDTLVNGYSYT